MIVLLKNDYEKMTAYAVSRLPQEACGLLAGVVEDGHKIIKKVYYLTNVDHSALHFQLDPKEQMEASKDMRTRGWQLLGNWHSHTKTAAKPSAEDIRLAHDEALSYMILSLADGEDSRVQSYHLAHGEMQREELQIV